MAQGTQENQETKTNLRIADNEITVAGLLSEKDLKEDDEKIVGSLTIQTDEINSLKFNVYVKQKKNDGKPNPAYKGMKTIMETWNSIADVGKEEADYVAVRKGSLDPSTYYDASGFKQYNMRFKSSFFTRTDIDTDPNGAQFAVDIYISAMIHEVDKEGTETGRLIVRGWLALFGGIVETIDLIAPKEIASAVESNYSVGKTAGFGGDIINSKVIIKKEVAALIGKPKVETSTEFKHELIITSSFTPYEEGSPKAYTKAQINAAINARDERIEENKNKNNKSKSSNSNTASHAGSSKPANSGRKLPF